MKNSTILIFSIVKNIKDIFEKNKKVNIFKLVHEVHYENVLKNRRCKNMITIYKNIYNDIENNYYSIEDFVIALCYMYIFADTLKITSLYKKNILMVNDLFSSNRLQKDKELILNIDKKVKLGHISKYFNINENGESIIYMLIKTKKISPNFFITFSNKFLTYNTKNIILSQEYIKFENIINLIKIIKQKGGNYA